MEEKLVLSLIMLPRSVIRWWIGVNTAKLFRTLGSINEGIKHPEIKANTTENKKINNIQLVELSKSSYIIWINEAMLKAPIIMPNNNKRAVLKLKRYKSIGKAIRLNTRYIAIIQMYLINNCLQIPTPSFISLKDKWTEYFW